MGVARHPTCCAHMHSSSSGKSSTLLGLCLAAYKLSYAPPQQSSALITATTCAAEKCCVAIRYFANPECTYHAQHWQQHHPLSFVIVAAWLYVACWAGVK